MAKALLAILLVVSLVGTNVAMTADRTALNADYVTTTLEEEDGYATATDVIERSISDRIEAVTVSALDQLPEEIGASETVVDDIVDDALTEQYVRTQINDNIEEIYAYLHGDREDIPLEVELTPVKSNFAESVSDRMIAVDAAALSEIAINELGSEIPVEATIVQQLLEDETSYQRAKANFQDSIPDAVSLATVNERLKADLEAATRNELGEYDQQLTEAVVQIQFTTVDALTTDMSYQEYRQAVEDHKQRIAERVQQIVRDRLNEEVPDTISLSEQLDGNARDRLDTARTGFSLMGLMNVLLPAFALVVLVLGYLLSRSLWSVGNMAGWSALIAGIFGLLPAVLARDPVTTLLRNTISGEGSEQFADVAVALVGGILTTLRNQSLLLILIGVVLLVVVYADRRGAFDGVRRGLGFGPAPREEAVSNEPVQNRPR